LDAEIQREPWVLLRDLRDSCPVSYVDADGERVITVTRYDDVVRVYRDYRRFGNIGHHPSRRGLDAVPVEARNLSSLDPPRHTDVRRLYLVALKPAAIDAALPAIEQHVRALTNEIASVLAAGQSVDMVAAWAVPVPARAIATVLGLPVEDAGRIHDWVESQFSDTAIKARESESSMRALVRRNEEFDAYLQEQIEARRATREPPDDAITRMLAFRRADGSPFPDTEVRFFVRDILIAGNETTTSLMSNLLHRMLTVPSAMDAVRADPSLVDSAVEEALRLDTPLTQFAKLTHHDAEIGGFDVPAGEVLSLSLQSANRDERHFGADAAEFVVERFAGRHPDHVGFGVGIHLCVGAYLARRTTRAALTAIADTGLRLAVAPGYEYDKVYFYEFRRPHSLDIVRAMAAPIP
jgi:cytochrome P450